MHRLTIAITLALLMQPLFAAQPATPQEADPCLDSLTTPGLDPERTCSDVVAELESLLAPTASDTRALASAYNNRAVARIHAGDLEAAAGDLGRAMTLLPNNWVTHLNRGNLRLNLGQHQAALQDFQLAAGLPGAEQDSLARNASFALRALGDLDGSQRLLFTGARLSPAAPATPGTNQSTADTPALPASPDP